MVVCRLLMFTTMGWIPAESIDFSTAGYSQYPPAPRFAVIPVIRQVDLWLNAVRTLRISLVTTQLSIPESNTNCTTTFYIDPWARTIAPVLYKNLTIIPHRLQTLRRLR